MKVSQRLGDNREKSLPVGANRNRAFGLRAVETLFG